MRFGLWAQPPRHERAIWAVGSARPDFYIANIETDFDYEVFDADAFRDVHPTLEAACATTFGAFVTVGIGDDHRKAAPLQRNGFDCMGEAYQNDNPQATPDAMQVRARHCWWPGCSVVLGAGWGSGQQRLSQYNGVERNYPWSVYTAETLDEDDWQTIKRWTGA